MSTHADSSCPHCGADVQIEYWKTYQGVRPHGGYVTRSEVTDKSCDCEWTDEDFEAMRESETVHTQADRNFSSEEIHRSRYGY